MRLLDYLTGFAALILLPCIAWWGVNQSPQSAARLEARLQAAAAQALQRAGVDWARVEMDGQTAILSGAAPSEDAVPDAAAIVLRSSGGGGLVFGGVSQVRTRVEAAAPVWPYVWTAEKSADGGIVLAGHVPSRAAREALLLEAEAIAKGTVEDRMVLAAGAPEGNWQGIAQHALLQLAELDTGSARLDGHVLTLRGAEPDDAARGQRARAVRSVAAPFRGVALIDGGRLWSASLAGEGVLLEGAVPAESDRRALLAAARRAFPAGVQDEMILSPTAVTGWTAGAEAGLVRLADFETGRMSFDPAAGGFIFEGSAPASTLEFLTQDMARVAGDWAVDVGASPSSRLETAALGAASPAAAVRCDETLNALLDSGAVGFKPGEAAFRADSAAALDDLAETAKRCGELVLLVDEDALNQVRAARTADFLERAGARRPRIAAIAYGPANGPQGKDKGAALTSERPLEFTLRERSGQ